MCDTSDSELEGDGKYYLNPIISRVGGKSKLRETIVPLIPTDIKTYVEPFIGGGSIFLSKEKYAPVEVINDKDTDIVDILRDIQKVSPRQFEAFDFTPNREKFDTFRDGKRPASAVGRFYRNLYLSKISFSGNRRSFADDSKYKKAETMGRRILVNLDKYKQRLKDVKILNKDYTDVIKEYNSPDTFFYLDPPYSEQKSNWGYKFNLTPQQILDVLDTIKGHFLMSYDNTKENREVFNKYHLYSVGTKYQIAKEGNNTSKTELLISNYPLKGKNVKAINGGSKSSGFVQMLVSKKQGKKAQDYIRPTDTAPKVKPKKGELNINKMTKISPNLVETYGSELLKKKTNYGNKVISKKGKAVKPKLLTKQKLTGGRRLPPMPDLTMEQFQGMYGKPLERSAEKFAGADGDRLYKEYMDNFQRAYEARKLGRSPINPTQAQLQERDTRIKKAVSADQEYKRSPEFYYETFVKDRENEPVNCPFNNAGGIDLDKWTGKPVGFPTTQEQCMMNTYYNTATGKLDPETAIKRRRALMDATNRDVGFWEQFGRGFTGSLTTFAKPILDVASFIPVVGTVARGLSTAIDFIPEPKNEIAGEGKPTEKIFYKTADFAYETNPPKEVGDFVLFKNTPTMDAWINWRDNTIMIAVRGSKDFRDLKANTSLPFNNLINTQRYKEDKATIQQILAQFPPSAYEYYLSGHSLGGAVVAQLKKDFPLLKDAVVYNSAYQTNDIIREDPTIKKLYTTDDPLYKLAGKSFKNKVVVPVDSGFLRGISGILGSVARGYSGHKLTKFKSLYGEGVVGV